MNFQQPRQVIARRIVAMTDYKSLSHHTKNILDFILNMIKSVIITNL